MTVALSAAALPLGMAMPASASTTPTSSSPVVLDAVPDHASVMGVGWGNQVGVNRAVFQCPSGICNQGQAYAGNQLRLICVFWGSDGPWIWAFNRANHHEGLFRNVDGAGLPTC